MSLLESVTLFTLLAILSVSHVIHLLERLGLLPDAIDRRFKRKRAEETVQVLRELGLDVEVFRSRMIALENPAYFPGSDFRAATRELIESATRQTPVNIGRTQHSHFPVFVDLMGASTDRTIAERAARLLSTYLVHLLRQNELNHPRFDFVVGIKEGTPILAYELANLRGERLALFTLEKKFESATSNFHASFDIRGEPPLAGQVALIVDDSSTGGRKAMAAVVALRQFGYAVGDCLVLFEPEGKGAREVLAETAVKLHSIRRGPSSTD
jgi:orotate phosphoribosyltransferase